jgi:hypothetical protein
MRKPIDSPFSPGADSVPQVWAGRTAQLSDWRDVLRPRRISGIPERGRTILGEAGLGKSSLVRRIASEASECGDWVTPQLRIPSGTDPLKVVAAALLRLAEKAGLSASRDRAIADLLARVETVAAAGISVSLRDRSGPEPHSALSELLIEIGRAAVTAGDVVVLVHIDEIQNINDEHALSQLLIALGDSLAFEDQIQLPGGVHADRALPIAVYLTGLPEFDDMAGARKGATFVRRFQTTVLSPIDGDDLKAALQPFITDGWPISEENGRLGRVFMEPGALRMIADLACGEPFLFQLAGERAWYADTDSTITCDDVVAGWSGARSEAESHVLRILDRLPAREREFVESMAELAPEARTLTKIANHMGYQKATDAGPTSQRLDIARGILNRGKPYSFRHRAIGAYLTTHWPDVPVREE